MNGIEQFINEYRKTDHQDQDSQEDHHEKINHQKPSEEQSSCKIQTKELESKTDILDNIPFGIYVFQLEKLDDDSSFRLIYANKESEQSTGVPVDRILGKTIDDNFPQLRNQEIPKVYADVIRSQTKHDLGDIHYQDDRIGSNWYHMVAFPLLDNCLGISFTKVTEQKEAQEQLRLKKEQFQLAIKGSHDGIWDWNLRTNELFLSSRWKEQIGYGPDELSDDFSSFENNLHPDDKQRVLEYIDAYLKGDIKEYDIEFRLHHKDGSYRWIRARGEAIRDDQGKPFRMAGSHTDITIQKIDNERLRESEEKFRSISDTAQDGIIVSDEHDNVMFWNASAERIFGYTSEEMMGRNLHQTIAPQFLNDRYAYDISQFRQTGKNRLTDRTYELTARRKDGTPVPIELSLSSFLKNDTYHAIGIVRDISDRKKAEQALTESKEQLERTNQILEQRNKEVETLLQNKDEFLHILTHDLKNPLSTPMTVLPVLESKISDENQKEMIEVSMRTLRNMKRIINETLALAQLDDPKNELTFTDINLSEKVKTVLENNQGLLDQYHFQVETKIDDQLQVNADDFQFEEVLNNLISNAIKYTPDDVNGKIKIKAGLNDEGVWLSIGDNGQGLTQDQAEKVFEKFYKTGKPRQGMESTGLGLGIVKNIIDKHHGRIWVESPGLGKGSTFHILIPFHQMETPDTK